MDRVMDTCHKEVTSQHGIHISNLTRPGSPGGTCVIPVVPSLVCEAHSPIPLAHIIAGISAMTRGLLVTPFSYKSSPADGGDCLFLVGLPKLHGDDNLNDVCSPPLATSPIKGEGSPQREAVASWNIIYES